MPERRILLEVAVASVADALAAEQGGADRVELNSAMPLGGLTPSLGLLNEVKRQIRIPVMVMIRPRPGGFCYIDSDIEVMRSDTELAIANGADGLVFGLLDARGAVDRARCQSLLEMI